MKLSKKLIPAIAMLALSTVMLVTSSFAWFATNSTVSANGMKVSAKAEQVYLQIIKSDASYSGTFADNGSQTFVEFDNDAVALFPTNLVKAINTTDPKKVDAYDGGSTFVWVNNTSSSYGDQGVTGDTADNNYSKLNFDTQDVKANYVLEKFFKIRLDPNAGAEEASGELRISEITLETANTDDFMKSLCVFVSCTIGSTTLGDVWNYNGTSFVPTVKADADADPATVNLSSGHFSAANDAKISICIFFNGDSEYCTMEKFAAIAANEVSVNVTFTVEPRPTEA